MKKFERDPTLGSIVMELLARFSSAVGEIAPTGRHRRVVPIPPTPSKTAYGNSCKKFQRDPTVGSIVMHLLTRFSSVIGGMGPTGCR